MKKMFPLVVAVMLLAVSLPSDINANSPPGKPTLTGTTNGETGNSYTYTMTSTDPDGDRIYYCVNWGDGNEFCTDMMDSGTTFQASHAWESDGTYTITVTATDEHDATSEPATLSVTMPLSINTDGEYTGTLRIYVVEPTSRWDDHDDNPYHFGFLDFAYNEQLSIPYGETFTETVTWDANQAGYGDVDPNNIMAIAAVFNPRATTKYAYPQASRNPFTAYFVDATAGAAPGETASDNASGDFTHTVFVEEGTATWCPYCPAMSEALYSVYQSGDYPFYFVAMVADKNTEAANRLSTDFNIYGYPTAFFDGGYKVVVGGISSENPYRSAIQASGAREAHDLDLTISVDWQGGGVMEIQVDITNNEEIINTPPDKPVIAGPTSGKANETYNYTFSATDPDGDQVQYCIDWGDGTELCTSFYNSGREITLSHIWEEKGDYTITVIAKDNLGWESEPATLSVSMPLDYTKNMEIGRVVPREGYLYVFGKEVLKLPFATSIVIGRMPVTADIAGTDTAHVRFMVDGITIYTDTEAPYEYVYDGTFGRHLLRVEVYDASGTWTAEDIHIYVLNI